MLTRAPTRELQDLLRWLSARPDAERDVAENEYASSSHPDADEDQRERLVALLRGASQNLRYAQAGVVSARVVAAPISSAD